MYSIIFVMTRAVRVGVLLGLFLGPLAVAEPLKFPCQMQQKITLWGEVHECAQCEKFRRANEATGAVNARELLLYDPKLKSPLPSVVGWEDRHGRNITDFLGFFDTFARWQEKPTTTNRNEVFDDTIRSWHRLENRPMLQKAWRQASKKFTNGPLATIARQMDLFAKGRRTQKEFEKIGRVAGQEIKADLNRIAHIVGAWLGAYLAQNPDKPLPQSKEFQRLAREPTRLFLATLDRLAIEVRGNWIDQLAAPNIIKIYCLANQEKRDLNVRMGALHLPGIYRLLALAAVRSGGRLALINPELSFSKHLAFRNLSRKRAAAPINRFIQIHRNNQMVFDRFGQGERRLPTSLAKRLGLPENVLLSELIEKLRHPDLRLKVSETSLRDLLWRWKNR